MVNDTSGGDLGRVKYSDLRPRDLRMMLRSQGVATNGRRLALFQFSE